VGEKRSTQKQQHCPKADYGRIFDEWMALEQKVSFRLREEKKLRDSNAYAFGEQKRVPRPHSIQYGREAREAQCALCTYGRRGR